MTPELAKDIVNFLQENGITAKAGNSCIAVSRNNMCNSKFAVAHAFGVEETAYPNTLAAIQEKFGQGKRFMWGFRTDDNLFLEFYEIPLTSESK